MPENNKGQNPESGARFEKLTRSVLESNHPIFSKIKKELPNFGSRQEPTHPWVERLKSWDKSFHLQHKLFALGIAALLSFFIFRQITDPFMDYKLGDVAQRHLVAPKTIEFLDEDTTEAKRKTALDAILSVYDYDRRIFYLTSEKIRKAFAMVRAQHEAVLKLYDKKSWTLSELEQHPVFEGARKAFSQVLETEISAAQFETLVRLKFPRKVEKTLVHLLSKVNLNLIVPAKETIINEQVKGIVLNKISDSLEKNTEQHFQNVDSMIDLEMARQEIQKEAEASLDKIYASSSANIIAIAKKLVVPNVTLNKQETENRKRDAVREIKPVVVKINKGETIVRYGENINKRHLAVISQFEKNSRNDNSALQFLFTTIFLFIIIYSFYSFIEKGLYPYRYTVKDLAVFLVLMVASILAVKGIQFIAVEALIDKFPQIPFDFYYFLIPVAAGPVIIRMITAKEPAIIFSLVMGVVGGILLERNFFYACYIIASSLTATALANRIKTRGVIYNAGLITGLVNVVLIACIVANTRNAASLSMLWNDMGWIFWSGILSGLFTSVAVVAIVPLIEIVSGHTTDLRLLELANMNHPLLKDLMVKAPGTYHHSIVIGSLVEAGAESIGANPLLARVMAYYHDVGKMERPMYFIENQGGGYNKHDSLQPHMSAMIIREHVKRGQELGRKYKLPQPIIDAMSEHHGSSTIWYFYNKARSVAEDPESVLESDYKYDGEKPQSKETALVMLGDVVEAATRSIADPTPLRLSGVVKNILNKYFAEGQLSECDLTLRDLDLIAKSFMDVLLGIYHARIEYNVPTLKDGSKKRQQTETQKASSRATGVAAVSGASSVTPITKAYQIPRSGSSGTNES